MLVTARLCGELKLVTISTITKFKGNASIILTQYVGGRPAFVCSCFTGTRAIQDRPPSFFTQALFICLLVLQLTMHLLFIRSALTLCPESWVVAASKRNNTAAALPLNNKWFSLIKFSSSILQFSFVPTKSIRAPSLSYQVPPLTSDVVRHHLLRPPSRDPSPDL